MTRRLFAGLGAALLLVTISACAASPTAPPTNPTATVTTASAPQPTTLESAPAEAATNQIVGTIVRFTSDQTIVDVTIGADSPTVRDFLSLLPLETVFEEFNGHEKIGYLSRELTTEGTAGSDPENGDLIYYAPWGNLGFYYNTDGVGYSDATLHIGRYSATEDQLALLEGGGVTIEIID